MKINEIVTEGILDFGKKAVASAKGLKGGISGAKAGWQAQGSKNVQTDKINKATSVALQKWSEVAQSIQTSTGELPTPEQAQQWFAKFSGTPATSAPVQMSDVGIKNWLTKEVSGYMASKAMAPAPAPQQPASTAPAATAPTAPNRPTSTPVSQAQLSPKTSVVSYDPMVIKYNNTDYSINDAGEWAKFGSKVPVPQALGKFLDQQEDIIVRSTQSADPYQQAPATPAPVQPKQRTGGRVAGQVSQTPNAIAQRQARAARQAAQTKVNPTV